MAPSAGVRGALRPRIAALRRLYGRPKRPAVTDPFEQVLWENVAYLADDERRATAFDSLREKVGLRPRDIFAAPQGALREVGRLGILPSGSAEKLRECARIALAEPLGDARSLRSRSLREAKNALRKFPSIGEPSAEKILLFAGTHVVFSMDSNVLRVLLRLGYGKEQKSYAASYRSVREALAVELPRSSESRIETYQLLRHHGQHLCRRTHPLCEACPLRAGCAHGRSAQLAQKT